MFTSISSALGMCLLSCWVFAGAAWAADPTAPSPGAWWFSGQLRPRLCGQVRVPGDGSGQILTHLADDGVRVRAGQRVASVAWGMPDPVVTAEHSLGLELAKRERELARLALRESDMRDRLTLAGLQVLKAKLANAKASVLSKRDAALLLLDARQAAFEVTALERLLAAQLEKAKAVEAYHGERVHQARSKLEFARKARAALDLAAPCDGRVWLPVAPGLGRAVQVGDRLEAGLVLLGVGGPGGLQVSFSVSETQVGAFGVGRAVTIQSVDGRRETYGRIVRRGVFARKLGQGGPGLVTVVAELPDPARGFSPGDAVRVGP